MSDLTTVSPGVDQHEAEHKSLLIRDQTWLDNQISWPDTLLDCFSRLGLVPQMHIRLYLGGCDYSTLYLYLYVDWCIMDFTGQCQKHNFSTTCELYSYDTCLLTLILTLIITDVSLHITVVSFLLALMYSALSTVWKKRFIKNGLYYYYYYFSWDFFVLD